MTRVLADPPSRTGGILTKRELDAALRVLSALRRPQPASAVMVWDNDMQDMLGGLQRARYVETRPAYGGLPPRKASAPFRPDILATTDLGSEYLDSIHKTQKTSPGQRHHATKKRKTGHRKTAQQLDRAEPRGARAAAARHAVCGSSGDQGLRARGASRDPETTGVAEDGDSSRCAAILREAPGGWASRAFRALRDRR